LRAKDDFMYRTDLRVVRMERLYNRKAYKRHQNTLQLVTMVRNTLLDNGRLISLNVMNVIGLERVSCRLRGWQRVLSEFSFTSEL
jgi:hypothetical protein